MADWIIRRLSAEDERPSFDCGEQDLNEFFAVDSIKSGRELLSVTYVVVDKSDIVAFFSLSNDWRIQLRSAIQVFMRPLAKVQQKIPHGVSCN